MNCPHSRSIRSASRTPSLSARTALPPAEPWPSPVCQDHGPRDREPDPLIGANRPHIGRPAGTKPDRTGATKRPRNCAPGHGKDFRASPAFFPLSHFVYCSASPKGLATLTADHTEQRPAAPWCPRSAASASGRARVSRSGAGASAGHGIPLCSAMGPPLATRPADASSLTVPPASPDITAEIILPSALEPCAFAPGRLAKS